MVDVFMLHRTYKTQWCRIIIQDKKAKMNWELEIFTKLPGHLCFAEFRLSC